MIERKCETPLCRSTPQPGEMLCMTCEIASWQDRLIILPCGHQVASVIHSDDGTAYCSDCAREAMER